MQAENIDSDLVDDMKVLPKVSVCVVTYNHEKYIRQCLESLVSQEVDFPYEIIVSDDCSSDDTVKVVKEIAQQHSMVKLIEQEKNIGAYKNFVYVHSLASGEYVAHMDGDDYALPGKLKAQVDFLDAHKECNIVFHRVMIDFGPKGLVEDLIDVSKLPSPGFNRLDLIRHLCIGTNSSKMYRRQYATKEYPNFNIIDYHETVMQVAQGYASYVDGNFYGVYRAGIGIASSGLGTRYAVCDSLRYFSKNFKGARSSVAAAALFQFLVDLKNNRETWRDFFDIWVENFSLMSFFYFLKDSKVKRMLKSPRP